MDYFCLFRSYLSKYQFAVFLFGIGFPGANICQSLFHALLDLPNRMAISTDESIGGSAMLVTCQALLSLPFQQRDPPREHIESANL